MTPLIRHFTKHLQPCSGCGKTPFDIYDSIKKGEMQKIAISFVIEAKDPYDDKILSLVKLIKDQGGEISSSAARPQQIGTGAGSQRSIVAGGQHQQTTTQQVPG